MNLDEIIITSQQEEGLKAFRAAQEDRSMWGGVGIRWADPVSIRR